MASVVVYSAEKIDDLTDEAVTSAVINGSGNLILTKKNGDTIDAGHIPSDHASLTGLSADDHPQYAKADGTRGAFATTAQGGKADAARVNKNSTILFNAGDSDATLETVTITDDGTSTGGWLNRMVFQFRDSLAGAVRKTTYVNEYGELRVAAAKTNTTPMRVFLEELPTSLGTRDATVPVLEIMDNRTDRNSLWHVRSTGVTYVMGIGMANVLVLATGASVPAGTPAGTVIVRTA